MTAPRVLDGVAFLAFAGQLSTPAPARGDLAVMDTPPAHTPAVVRVAIAATGARPMVPPPSRPVFNPIDMAFSKLKASLKKPAARTNDQRSNAGGRRIDPFTPAKCQNHVAAAG